MATRANAAMAVFWITRAEPGAHATAARLTALGHTPLIGPLLTLGPVPAVIDLAGAQAIAFTSANGLRAFAARSLERSLPAYCVGAATAAAARKAGFVDVHDADGDGEALRALISSRLDPMAGDIVHAAGAVRAFDLEKALAQHGLKVRTIVLYAASAVTALPEIGAQALAERPSALAGILFHSPLAAAAFAALIPESLMRCLGSIDALTLSAAIAAPIAHLPWRHVAVAESPSEAALFLHIRHLPTCGA
jgi:uroporphyrinogen-III synthase